MNTSSVTRPDHRFRPRLLPTVATIAGIVLFVSAGQWQHRRMEQKETLRSQFDVASAAPAVALPLDVADWGTWRYRPVIVQGSFDAARQILIDNKIEDGRPGYHVVTPLVLADGRAVLVDRGWVALGESRARLPFVVTPAGAIAVHGRVNIPTPNYVELSREAAKGSVWENLDPARFSAAAGLQVLPLVVEQTAAIDTTDTLVRHWPAPDFGIDRHRIYMVQWYLFAATAAGLWLYFNLRRAHPDPAP